MSGYRYRGTNFTIDDPAPKPKPPPKPSGHTPTRHCTLPNCNQPHEAKGYCRKHYERQRRTGTTKQTTPQTFEERLWAKVNKTGDCWLWTAATTTNGHPQMGENRIIKAPHRILWERQNGPLKPRQEIHNTCGNKRCINPHHYKALPPLTDNPSTTIKQIQQLAALGYPLEQQARLAGINKDRPRAAIRLNKTDTQTAKAINDLWHRLRNTPAPPSVAATQARTAAKRKGWQPPTPDHHGYAKDIAA